MQVLIPIGTLYPSEVGGPSNTMYWLAMALHQNGVQVTSITSDIGIKNRVSTNTWLQTDYGRVIYWHDRIHIFPIRLLYSTLRALPNHDIVHLNALFYFPSFIIALFALLFKKKIIWSVRGNLEPAAMQISTTQKRLFLALIKVFFNHKNTVFHATSSSELRNIHRILGKQYKAIEIPNFILVEAPSSPDPDVQPYLLYIGRIHPIKALENLLDALSISDAFMESSLKLHIVGDNQNEYGKILMSQCTNSNITNKVVFLGHIDGAEKASIYANAYCCILPSHSENFGNVVLESLSQGTPVIASTGTPWQSLEQNQSGLWVDNTPESLAKAIDTMINHSANVYQTYRTNALQMVKQQFDINNNITSWIHAYQNT